MLGAPVARQASPHGAGLQPALSCPARDGAGRLNQPPAALEARRHGEGPRRTREERVPPPGRRARSTHGKLMSFRLGRQQHVTLCQTRLLVALGL